MKSVRTSDNCMNATVNGYKGKHCFQHEEVVAPVQHGETDRRHPINNSAAQMMTMHSTVVCRVPKEAHMVVETTARVFRSEPPYSGG